MKQRTSASKMSPTPGQVADQPAVTHGKGVAVAPPVDGETVADRPPLQMRAAVHSNTPRVESENRTGLPDKLKAGIEHFSGLAMDDVRVHYNSPKPTQLQALAYTQGTEIHVGPGQERHLPHEAWHVVQQKQGRVRPTTHTREFALNDDARLEHEADRMGVAAGQTLLSAKPAPLPALTKSGQISSQSFHSPIQCVKTLYVNQQRTQNLTDPETKTGKDYQWTSSFVIYVYGDKQGETPAIQVVIYIETAATDEVFKKWDQQIQTAWNHKFEIINNFGKNYPITVQIIRAKEKEFKNYTVTNVKATKAEGGRGLFGTESMTTWGEEDPQDIPHEVGHMLGNKDEYGTVDGKDWGSAYALTQTDDQSIMRKGGQPVRSQHFDLILEEVQKAGGIGKNLRLAKINATKKQAISMDRQSSSKSVPSTIGKPSNTTSKKINASQPSGEKSLHIGKGPAPVANFDTELGLKLHTQRVKQITTYLLAGTNSEKLTPEQMEFLKQHDWNNDWNASAAAKRILNL